MKFDQLGLDLDRNGLRPAYALSGPEAYFRDAGWRLIRSQALATDPSAEVRTVDTIVDRAAGPPFDLARFLSDLATPMLFSNRSALRLRPADPVLKQHRERLLSYLEHPPVNTTLVLDLGGLDRRTRIAKRMEACGALVECPTLFASPPPWSNDPPHENDLARWVAGEFSRLGKKVRLEDAQILCERVGSNLFGLAQEVEKLSAYTGHKKSVTAQEITVLVGDSRKARLFELSEAVFSGSPGKAIARTRRLFREGLADERGKTTLRPDSIALIALGTLTAEYRRVQAARRWLDESGGRGGERALAGAIGVRPFVAGRLLSAARRLERRDEVRFLRALDRCDQDLKSSARGSAEWILTRTICTLAER